MMKILIVDDKQEARYYLEVLLKSRKHEVFSAANGKAALEILKSTMIDLIISDILMPEMDGFKFCQIVKENENMKNIPFIFLTATYTDKKDEELALQLGADLFLTKPILPEKMLVEIETLFNRLKNGAAKSHFQKRNDEKEIYKLYNARLVQKLEKKNLDLEKEIQERHHVEEELFKSEQRFKVLTEYSPVGIFQTTANGSTIYVNPRWCQISGLSTQEALGDGWLAAVHPEDREKLFSAWQQATKTHDISVSEYRFIQKDGSITWVLGQAVPKKDKENRIIGYIGTITDITKRKLAEEALKSSEERLNILFDSAPEAYYLSDLKGNFLDGNKAAEVLLGYKRTELIGKNFLKLNLLPVREIAKASQLLLRNIQHKGTGPDELILRRKNGEQITVEIRTYPVKIQAKTVVLGIATDITERKRAEKIQETVFNISNALNTTKSMSELYGKIKEFLANIIDTTNFYIALYDEENDEISLPFVIDEKDIYQSFPAGKTLTKYALELGKPLFAPLELQNELTAKGLIEILGTPSKIWLGVPLKIEKKVIGLIAVQSYEDPSLYKEKDLEILSFISEEIALAVSHKKAEEQIKIDLREKTVLLQELYHRTKNNMQLIISMLKMQTRISDNENVNTVFLELINRINSMSLVHQKLYQAKDLSQINLKEYIEDLIYQLNRSYSLQAARVSLKFEMDDVFVLIDSAIPLGLILNELISNVYKHAFPDNNSGEIRIRLYVAENDMINIHIADNGVGIPADLDLRKVTSMGLETMFTLIEHQLRGEISYAVDNGLKWHIKFKDEFNKRRV